MDRPASTHGRHWLRHAAPVALIGLLSLGYQNIGSGPTREDRTGERVLQPGEAQTFRVEWEIEVEVGKSGDLRVSTQLVDPPDHVRDTGSGQWHASTLRVDWMPDQGEARTEEVDAGDGWLIFWHGVNIARTREDCDRTGPCCVLSEERCSGAATLVVEVIDGPAVRSAIETTGQLLIHQPTLCSPHPLSSLRVSISPVE